MSNWHGPVGVTGSIGPISSQPWFAGALHAFHFTTGSAWATWYEDRTGQIVSDGDPDRAGDNVYLVRESEGNVHTLAHPGGGEVRVDESDFTPFGGWKVLAR